MKFNPFLSPSLVGLDIQPHAIRLVQLRKTNKSFLVEQADSVKMPDEAFSDGKIRNWDAIHLHVSALVKKMALTGMVTAINLPANQVRMQHMQVPYGLSDAAIAQEIKMQLEKDFPGLSDSLNIDFNVVTPKYAGYSEVMFVVTREEYVSQYVACINAAGLKVKVVDVDVYALKRLFNFSSPKNNPEEIRAIICHINHGASLIIFAANEIIFHHQWHAETAIEFLAQLKSQIQIFLAAYRDKNIRRLAIYSDDKSVTNIIREADLFQDIEIEYPDPLASLTLNQKVNSENIADFFLACGSAMREVPRW